MKQQVAYSLFDPVTMRKVIKGFGFSFLSGLSAFITNYALTDNPKASFLVALAAVLAPFAVNTGNEYRSGVEK